MPEGKYGPVDDDDEGEEGQEEGKGERAPRDNPLPPVPPSLDRIDVYANQSAYQTSTLLVTAVEDERRKRVLPLRAIELMRRRRAENFSIDNCPCRDVIRGCNDELGLHASARRQEREEWEKQARAEEARREAADREEQQRQREQEANQSSPPSSPHGFAYQQESPPASPRDANQMSPLPGPRSSDEQPGAARGSKRRRKHTSASLFGEGENA